MIAAKTYVVGFMFNNDFTKVALIRKNKPAWQQGLLNGIGGKIEADESARDAMAREFFEETGVETGPDDWMHYLTMKGDEPTATNIGGSFAVECFACRGDLTAVRTMEDEKVEVIEVDSIPLVAIDMIENLPWAIALAIDCLTDGRPRFVTAHYPGE